MTALAFTVLALVLSGPVPAILARASWPFRAPRAAIVLWQAIAMAAVLSAFSAGIAIASRLFAPGPDGRPTTTITSEVGVLGWPGWVAYVVVFALTLVVGARLIAAVLQVAIATRRRRAHHRMVVDLVGKSRKWAHAHGLTRMGPRRSWGLGTGDGLRILDVDQPLAYCLPGVRSRVVVSEGALATLADNEIAAILSHERAHLRARHDLVLEMFTAVHAAFPRFVRSGSALDAVRLLVEMLADDAAVRISGPTPLARALVACAAGHTPKGALAAGGPTTVLRVRRLGGRPNSLALAAGAYAAAATVLVVPTIAVVLPWLTELQRLFAA
ncbi:M56 family metallopeptidase [Mycolicibacterium sp. ND9-15]|uniref:M56 family metallopeptidase n=1 Tax=Mycolicibacterium sp. ND9-15 TaxID=3042320 RepID=UPI002DDBADA9|nr:M56 family metallopeptidase [Mycolicibacterium sp. ND9-15]WSE56328.1 M56 family metallopeptidase [Mycolicibacterium sp. ND9-15]